jgi:hypothetical protein
MVFVIDLWSSQGGRPLMGRRVAPPIDLNLWKLRAYCPWCEAPFEFFCPNSNDGAIPRELLKSQVGSKN